MNTIVENIKQSVNRINVIRRNDLNDLHTLVVEAIKPFMMAGGIQSIRWKQYASRDDMPDFNAYIDELKAQTSEGPDFKSIFALDKNSDVYKNFSTIVSIMQQLNSLDSMGEPILLSLFEDYRDIIIYADGTLVTQ